jgi:spore coat polysaccharide biosynthesis protein SpsF
MNPGIIVFARLNSTRLPGKALKIIAGKRLIDRVIDRIRQIEGNPLIVVATTTSHLDNPLVNHLENKGVAVFRGSSHDVAWRAACCAEFYKLKYFVRISGDSPFIDPNLINIALSKFSKEAYDLVTNVFPRTYPVGTSVEVIRMTAIHKLLALTKNDHDREHITPYFYDNARNFFIENFSSKVAEYRNISLAIDTLSDLKRITWVLKTFGESLDLKTVIEKSLLWRDH